MQIIWDWWRRKKRSTTQEMCDYIKTDIPRLHWQHSPDAEIRSSISLLYNTCVFDSFPCSLRPVIQGSVLTVNIRTFHSTTGGDIEIRSLLPLISDTELLIWNWWSCCAVTTALPNGNREKVVNHNTGLRPTEFALNLWENIIRH